MPTAVTSNYVDEEVQETLKSQALLWNHILSFFKSMCLKCAVELRIPDAIHRHGMPATVTELCDALSVPAAKSRNLRVLMRLLTLEGVFNSHVTLSGEEAFDLNAISRLITTSDPHRPSYSPLILMLLNHRMVDPCQQIAQWFHRPDVSMTPFEMVHGKTMWELAGFQPDFNDLVNEGMACDSRYVIDVVTKIGHEAFRGVGTLVDVGGGTGNTAKELTEAFPGLKCTVFDLPHVIHTAHKNADIEFVGGDMFTEVPSAEAVLLKWILHDWSDENCIKILHNCKKAIPQKEKGGKVIIIDMVVGVVGVDGQTSIKTQLFFDLEMMINPGGKERDEGEWRKLFIAAGFTDYKITPSIGLRSIIEVYP